MNLVRLALATVLLVPLSAGTVAAQDAAGASGTTEAVPCPPSIVKGAALAASGTEVEGQTYSCGVVVVPEDYSKPDGRTIELFYLKLHSPAASPAQVPLVYLAGGPGSSGSYEVSTNPTSFLNLAEIRKEKVAAHGHGRKVKKDLTITIIGSHCKGSLCNICVAYCPEKVLGMGFRHVEVVDADACTNPLLTPAPSPIAYNPAIWVSSSALNCNCRE